MVWHPRIFPKYWATTLIAKPFGNCRALARCVPEFTQLSTDFNHFGKEHSSNGMSSSAQSATLFAMALSHNDGHPIDCVRNIAAKAFSRVVCRHERSVGASFERSKRKSPIIWEGLLNSSASLFPSFVDLQGSIIFDVNRPPETRFEVQNQSFKITNEGIGFKS
mgnify:CR=1 FL=1